jgi:hypothetical protein
MHAILLLCARFWVLSLVLAGLTLAIAIVYQACRRTLSGRAHKAVVDPRIETV